MEKSLFFLKEKDKEDNQKGDKRSFFFFQVNNFFERRYLRK